MYIHLCMMRGWLFVCVFVSIYPVVMAFGYVRKRIFSFLYFSSCYHHRNINFTNTTKYCVKFINLLGMYIHLLVSYDNTHQLIEFSVFCLLKAEVVSYFLGYLYSHVDRSNCLKYYAPASVIKQNLVVGHQLSSFQGTKSSGARSLWQIW